MTLTPEVLEELERLEREATPAPWRAGTSDTDCVFGCMGDGSLMAPPLGRVLMRTNLHFPVFEADARIVAAMRNALPGLLAAARERDRLLANMKRAGVECWMPEASPLEVSEHMDRITRSYVDGLQQTKRALKLAQAYAMVANMSLYHMQAVTCALAGDGDNAKRRARAARLCDHYARKFHREAEAIGGGV